MDDIADRVLALASYIIDTKSTVRQAAAVYGVSKSTVHKDVSERLSYLNPAAYRSVRAILDTNKAERHIRGGNATKFKYEHLAQMKNKI